jgi:hypothetical protein
MWAVAVPVSLRAACAIGRDAAALVMAPAAPRATAAQTVALVNDRLLGLTIASMAVGLLDDFDLQNNWAITM